MNVIIRKDSPLAIYEQIVSQIKEHISKGLLKEGDMLPSIRLLAKELEVSVITTKRAYSELELEGFIISVAGKGSYVSGLKKSAIQSNYKQEIKAHLEEIHRLADASGLDLETIRKMMEDEWK